LLKPNVKTNVSIMSGHAAEYLTKWNYSYHWM